MRRILRSVKRRLQSPPDNSGLYNELYWLRGEVQRVREALGRVETRQLAADATEPGQRPLPLQHYEFRAFSQFGEDGILQHLVRHVPIPRRAFVEFGVESFKEANSRFLMLKDNWSGLVIDADSENIAQINRDPQSWYYDLHAVCAFVDRDSINRIIRDNGFAGDLGLLSIDIDGTDWWIWETIDSVRPAIVVTEYNHRFGTEPAVTVPYRPDFDRRKAHHSLTYFGASLRAFERLGRRKGYDLVGCGSAGLNAFFVRSDLRPAVIPALSVEEAFVEGKFCEWHDPDGTRRRVDNEQQRQTLFSLPLVEIDDAGHART